MGRRKMGRRRSLGAMASSGRGKLTIDRAGRSGHYQGSMYSEVYKDGKVHLYTAWNDNNDDVGAEMPFEEWVKSIQKRV